MVFKVVTCPRCGSENVRKFGFDKNNNQRYECKNINCDKKIFILEYNNNGCVEGIDDKIIKMTLNGRGIRDISRVLEISTYKVMDILKKKKTY